MDDKNNISAVINYDYIKKMFPVVRFMNALNRHNESKIKGS